MEYRRYGTIPSLETRAESHEFVDKKKRYNQIINILKDSKQGMTAKQIAVEMCKRGYVPTTERNWSAPRLTELSKEGYVEQIGKAFCQYTGRKVAVYKLLHSQVTIYDIL